MSGGAFNYNQRRIADIYERIELEIRDNGRLKTPEELKDERSWLHHDEEALELHHYAYPQEIIDRFKEAVEILKKAEIYAQRIDYLLSGDDGEESFLERLEEELNEIK